MYYTLYCTLHYTVLYTTLYYTLHCTILYTVLHTILYTTLLCTIHYTVHYNTLYYTLPYALSMYTTLDCTQHYISGARYWNLAPQLWFCCSWIMCHKLSRATQISLLKLPPAKRRHKLLKPNYWLRCFGHVKQGVGKGLALATEMS